MDNYKKGGLNKNKYLIEKWDKTLGRYMSIEEDAQYFILRVDKDPHALRALEFYRHSVRKDNLQLSNDLTKWIKELKDVKLEGKDG